MVGRLQENSFEGSPRIKQGTLWWNPVQDKLSNERLKALHSQMNISHVHVLVEMRFHKMQFYVRKGEPQETYKVAPYQL